jgi:hypothetical protein
MKFIIENLTKEPSWLELSKAAKELGHEVQDIRGDYKRADIAHYQNEQVILFASIEMNNLIGPQLKEQGCYPGNLSTFSNYLCQKFYPFFGDKLFNDNYAMIPLSELDRRKYFFYDLFGREANIFVRPDSGEKTFKAGLVDLQDFDSFYSQTADSRNDLVVVSSPKDLIGEWRFLCNDRKEILALSSYRYQGLLTRVPSAPPKAHSFVKEILDIGYFPDKVFCVDVAQAADGEFYLMELTSCSSAGLYSMDMSKVITGIVNSL